MTPDLRIPAAGLMHTRRLPPNMKNYVILAPPATHFRPSTCAEVQCDRFVNGWETHLDVATKDGLEAAEWIESGKHGNQYTKWRAEGSTIVVFRFPPFQPRIFGIEHREHRVKLDRPEWFGVRDVDTGWQLKLHSGAENGARDWTHDFATNQDLVAAKRREG